MLAKVTHATGISFYEVDEVEKVYREQNDQHALVLQREDHSNPETNIFCREYTPKHVGKSSVELFKVVIFQGGEQIHEYGIDEDGVQSIF